MNSGQVGAYESSVGRALALHTDVSGTKPRGGKIIRGQHLGSIYM